MNLVPFHSLHFLHFQLYHLPPTHFNKLNQKQKKNLTKLLNMSRATVELDFFGLEKGKKSLHRQRSFREIQSAISKINPKLLKSVIASGSASQKSSNSEKSLSVPASPNGDQIVSPALPVYVPNDNNNNNVLHQESTTAPLTIFYNGTISVFYVPRAKAESILKLVIEGSSKAVESATVDPNPTPFSTHETQLLDNLNGDLPIARKKSLQRFLEKRKERMTFVSPYACYT